MVRSVKHPVVAATAPVGGRGLRDIPPAARPWFVVNAVVAWAAVLSDVVVTVIDPPSTLEAGPGDFGYAEVDGLAGALTDALDFASYFTTWSLVAAAVVTTVLAVDPARHGLVLRVARLTSVLMLTVTVVATVIALPVWLAAGGVLADWQIVLQLLRHGVAPVVTLVVWVVLGPRGWIDRTTALWSVAVPIVWLAWTFGRGAVVDAYPYDPINVVALGYGPVLLSVLGVLVAGLLMLAALVRLDHRLGSRPGIDRPASPDDECGPGTGTSTPGPAPETATPA